MKSPFLRRFGMPSPFFDNEAGFSPITLFALNEPGLWLDPSDLTTLFQDTAGTTPVTTPGQTVALALDKSKGLVLGSELVTIADLSAANGNTTVTTVGASKVATSVAAGTFGFARVIGSGIQNKTHRITISWSNNTSGALFVDLGNITQSLGATVSGQLTFVATPTTGTGFNIYRPSAASGGMTFSIDNVSVKELSGAHATQATAASRPTYGIVPLGGRRNLLTRTEEFDNAVWTKSGSFTVTSNNATSPIGDMTADTITFTGGFQVLLTDTATSISGLVVTGSIYVKGVAGETIALSAGGLDEVFTLNGQWQRFSLTKTAITSTTNAFNINTFSGATARVINVWGAQLETGSSATAYQRVGSAFDVTEAGVQSLSYLSFDGVDDFLVTPTITPGIDKVQVFAGVRKLSDAAGIVAEFSPNVSTNAGSFYLASGLDTGVAGSFNGYTSISRGSASADPSLGAQTTANAPDTAVLTATHDIVGDLSTLRRNGIVGSNATGDKGTGNFLAYPLYIGRRAGVVVPFNGNLFSLIVRFGANLDAGTITSTETWVNDKTGAY